MIVSNINTYGRKIIEYVLYDVSDNVLYSTDNEQDLVSKLATSFNLEQGMSVKEIESYECDEWEEESMTYDIERWVEENAIFYNEYDSIHIAD